MAKRITVSLDDLEEEVADRERGIIKYTVWVRKLIREEGERRGHIARGQLTPRPGEWPRNEER